MPRTRKAEKGATPAEVAEHKRATRELAEFKAKIAERQTWAFQRVATAGPTSKDPAKERWQCPAQAGKRRCENCPMSMRFPAEFPVVANPPAAATAPAFCTQRTVTIPRKALAKRGQRHYWGSDGWIASFNRRTHVEGAFGNLKNPSTENVRRGWCRVVGIVKTSIFTACAVAASNIRKL